MKRDWFEPHVRMTHRFAENANHDQLLGENTFEANIPVFPVMKSRGFGKRDSGEDCGRRDFSPVTKPSGEHATLSGPKQDYAEIFAKPTPASTKRRKTP